MFSQRIVCAYLYIITKHGYPPEVSGIFSYLEEMRNLGFQSIELEGIHEKNILEMYEIRHDVRKALDEKSLNVPFYCVVLPGLSSPDQIIREDNLAIFRKGCETAIALGAKGVLDNAPIPPYLFPKNIPIVRHYDDEILLSAGFPNNLSWKKHWTGLIETYKAACRIASEYNLTYLMHPCFGALSSTTDAFLYFADAVGEDNLRFNLDTANQYYLKDNLLLSLIRLKDRIDYIHISDNDGIKPGHFAVGKGKINWEIFGETLSKIGFKGDFGLDIGGAETRITDLDEAYISSANFIERWIK